MADHIETTTKNLQADERNLRYVLGKDNQRGMSDPEEKSWDRKLDQAEDKLRRDAANVSPAEARAVWDAMKAQEKHPLVKMDDGHLVFDNVRFQEEKNAQK